MKQKKYTQNSSLFHSIGAILTLVGTIIGAGILGIPYVFSRAGFLTGLVVIIFVSIFFMYIYLSLGETLLKTKGQHQLPGLAGVYLGKKGKKILFVAMLLSSYGSLVAYLIASGQALNNLFSSFIYISPIVNNPLFFSTMFFIIMSFLIFKGLNIIENSEIVITGILLFLILLLFVLLFPEISFSNVNSFSAKSLFVPYGAVFFALMGFTTVPEAVRIMDKDRSKIPMVLILSLLIPVVFYIIFSIAIIGVMGENTSELGTLGLEAIFGPYMLILSNLFLLFSVTTSFLAIGFAQKNVFRLDYNFPKILSLFLSCGVPFILFITLSKFMGFVDVLSFTGAVFGGMMVLLILVISYKSKKLSIKKVSKVVYNVPMNLPLLITSIIILIVGVLSLFF